MEHLTGDLSASMYSLRLRSLLVFERPGCCTATAGGLLGFTIVSHVANACWKNVCCEQLMYILLTESWKYWTVIGMLMYLAANTRLDIAFAVHQAARFSHAPRQSHAVAVKRILRYLKETQDKGLIMTPTTEHMVDCYVDADFAGAFAVENLHDPISVKSRTGYVILYRGSPLLWVSKMQTQAALYTIEAEYVALSQSMRDLIPICQLLHEIMTIVFVRHQLFSITNIPRPLKMSKLARCRLPLNNPPSTKTTMPV